MSYYKHELHIDSKQRISEIPSQQPLNQMYILWATRTEQDISNQCVQGNIIKSKELGPWNPFQGVGKYAFSLTNILSQELTEELQKLRDELIQGVHVAQPKEVKVSYHTLE